MLVSDCDTHTHTSDKEKPYSVTEAMALAKGALEGVRIRILGEVSEVNAKPGYKAVYFTVKDDGATLPCMMWVNRYRATGVELAVGSLVELSGRFTLYAQKGRMNFDVSSLSLAGEGVLRQQVAQLAEKLRLEGLTDPSRKVPVPAFPMKIGVVTSPRGAVLHDVLRTMRRRFPLSTIYIAGVPVEGATAPAQMIEGMRACYRAKVDVILLVRGGGSFEDLMPFNDELLARAISKCPIPVVTGIGHEPDTTIADLVSDLRASTPTAAAESVSAKGADLLDELRERVRLAGASLARRIANETQALAKVQRREVFRDPMALFETEMLTLDVYHDRIARALPDRLAGEQKHLDTARAQLSKAPAALSRNQLLIESRQRVLADHGHALLQPYQHDLAIRAAKIEDLSPLAVLARGYSVARNGEGHIVKQVAAVVPGDSLSVRVSDGTIHCTVHDTTTEER